MTKYQDIIIFGISNLTSRMSKNTSIALGEHWQAFIEKLVSSGRYGSASEVIRTALRLLEQRDAKIETLRAALVEGEASGTAGRLDIDDIKRKARQKARQNPAK
jgi:antitoxin ParD1/3/4